jgi:hypothetical protein
MAAFDPATLDRWRALAIVDRDGATVGTISEFYLDRETGYPTWALVNTGLFGATRTFVPLVHATEISDGLQVPYEKSHIKDSPTVDLHDELSPAEEATLFAHYGVDYEPSTEPATVEQEPEAEGGPGEAPGPVAAGPGSVEVTADTTEPGPDGAPGMEPEPVSSPPVQVGRGSGEPPGPVPAEPGSVDAGDAIGAGQGPVPPHSTREVPDEPGTDDAPRAQYDAGSGVAGDPVPDEPGTVASDEATQVHPDGLGSDPHLSRTAPVEPGLPGSTAASPYGPSPTTIDKDAGPAELRAEEPYGTPGGSGWAPGAAAKFEEHEPADQSAGTSDRWREAKLAAEQDRIARAAAAQPEDRSPLERARRRLERLVGGGQEPDDLSPTDRDAAERARRARLGFDEEDRIR